MNQQATPRPQIRRSVAHDLPQRIVQTDKPDQAATPSGIAVRTSIKAADLIFGMGTLLNNARRGPAGSS